MKAVVRIENAGGPVPSGCKPPYLARLISATGSEDDLEREFQRYTLQGGGGKFHQRKVFSVTASVGEIYETRVLLKHAEYLSTGDEREVWENKMYWFEVDPVGAVWVLKNRDMALLRMWQHRENARREDYVLPPYSVKGKFLPAGCSVTAFDPARRNVG